MRFDLDLGLGVLRHPYRDKRVAVVDAEHARRRRATAANVGVFAASIGALVATCLCVAVVCIGGYDAVVAPIVAPPEPPAESEFFGRWCSSQGDALTLRANRFTVVRMSPAFAGQIVHYGPTFEPGRSYRWDQPPATSAAGSWNVSVLGADIMAGQWVSIAMNVEQLDDEAVQSDSLDFDAYEQHDGWAFLLPLKPDATGDLAFTRCRAGA
jgi:hypothetical protein